MALAMQLTCFIYFAVGDGAKLFRPQHEPPSGGSHGIASDLDSYGFVRRAQATSVLQPNEKDSSNKTTSRVVQSRKITVIDFHSRTYDEPMLLVTDDGTMALEPPFQLPSEVQNTVVVAMENPRAERYPWLTQIADEPGFQVVIHCANWSLGYNGQGHEGISEKYPKWYVIIDPERHLQGTEDVRYLEHIALFKDSLSELNFFVQDDALDVTWRDGGEVHVPHFNPDEFLEHMKRIASATTKPAFINVGAHIFAGDTQDAALRQGEMHGSNLQSIASIENARCSDPPVGHPLSGKSASELRQAFIDIIDAERQGFGRHVFKQQYFAAFVVSRDRINERMPSRDAYGRILLKLNQSFDWCDEGCWFETCWGYFFSYCDQDTDDDSSCHNDEGSCTQDLSLGSLDCK